MRRRILAKAKATHPNPHKAKAAGSGVAAATVMELACYPTSSNFTKPETGLPLLVTLLTLMVYAHPVKLNW